MLINFKKTKTLVFVEILSRKYEIDVISKTEIYFQKKKLRQAFFKECSIIE